MDSITVDPSQVCRGFFVLATIAAISVNSIIPLRKLLVFYGARSVPSSSRKATSSVPPERIRTPFTDLAAATQVPHSWFLHYYITSVASSLFWGYQISTKGAVFRYLALRYAGNSQATMTTNQVIITWVFMAIQGIRRLYECITLNKSSEAKMPLTTWAAGIAFYCVLGVSIWIEGTRK
jgi:3-oxo-5-alpha-steroid 4-dehydrogenase 3 / polyprenol reductase